MKKNTQKLSMVRMAIFLGMATAFLVSSLSRTEAAPEIQSKPSVTIPPKHTDPDLPEFKEIEKAVVKTLTKHGKYYENDLIAQSQAAKCFAAVKAIGWDVPDSKKIVREFLADGDYLVKVLSTRKGHEFMRQMSKYPMGYDRLDRLRYVVKGKEAIHQLIHSKDGYIMIEYMTTTQEGKNMGKLVSNARNGKDFNKATGRLYTGKQLIEKLKGIYEQLKKGKTPEPEKKGTRSRNKSRTFPIKNPSKTKQN